MARWASPFTSASTTASIVDANAKGILPDPTSMIAESESTVPCLPSERSAHGREQGRLPFSARGVCGLRAAMEDAFCVHQDLPGFYEDANDRSELFAVFDGHAGHEVSAFCAQRLSQNLEACIRQTRCRSGSQRPCGQSILRRALAVMDADLRAQLPDESARTGSTALVAMYHAGRMHVAHCGDSRAVLCTLIADRLSAAQVTRDHKPNLPDELARIEASGGTVCMLGPHPGQPYVNGCLAMSRALGDHDLRRYGVTSEPEVTTFERTPATRFLILASDGVWDVIDNQEAANIVAEAVRLWSEDPYGFAARMLVDAALARHSRDNITAVVIDLTQAH